MIYYFDTSALVKYYVIEEGTEWVRRRIDEGGENSPAHLIYTTALSLVEVPAAFAIAQRTGRIGKALRASLVLQFMTTATARYHFLRADEQKLRYGAYLTQHHSLRAYDAVHLATAVTLGVDLDQKGHSLVFVSSDRQLLAAAAAEGLATEDPFDHTPPAGT